MKILITILILSVCAIAQSVPVVALSSSDAARVKRIHQDMLDAEKQWQNLQTDIQRRYLIVNKNDPSASDVKWYEDENPFGITSGTFITTVGTMYGGGVPQCETAKEVEERKAREVKAEEDHHRLQEERDVKARRVRKGWESRNCTSCLPAFDYSDDFRFLVRKPDPVVVPQNDRFFVNPATWTSSGSTVIDSPLTLVGR